MRIDFSRNLLNLDGSSIKDVTSGTSKDAVLSQACINALLADDPQRISGEEKLKRYQLATRIFKHKIVDITAEEISVIKQVVGQAYGPLIAGQCMLMLEEPYAVDLKEAS